MSDKVRPKDVVEGGIAVRTTGREIEVCPYLLAKSAGTVRSCHRLPRLDESSV